MNTTTTPFTPGPWTHEPCAFAKRDPEAEIPEGCEYWIASGSTEEVLALTSGPVLLGSQEANARLIAAAPELLAALKALSEACMRADSIEELSAEIDGSLLDAAHAAIDKAETRAFSPEGSPR